jgi:hypothetical protein
MSCVSSFRRSSGSPSELPWLPFVAVTALSLVAACRGSGARSPTGSAASKQAFVHELVVLCAGVNQSLATVDPKQQPGKVADQLSGLVSRARSGPTPGRDHEQLDALLSALTQSAAKFREAQTALAAGDAQQAGADTQEANQRLMVADGAALRYGMPHLADCEKTLQSGKPSGPPAAPQPALAWRSGQDAPIPVQQVAAAAVDGRVWVVGGLTETSGTGTEATRKVEAYDAPIDQWTTGPDLPVPLHHAMAVNYRGELVVLGGWVPQGGNLTAVTSDRVFALRGGTWVELPRLHHPRAAGAAAGVGDRVVVVGGRTSRELVTTTEVFDGAGWRDAAAIPTPRDHLAAVSDGPYLYAVGGRKLSSDQNVAVLERYNPTDDHWDELAPMPTPRGGVGAAVLGGRLIVVGGEAPTSVYAAVQGYDLRSGGWVSLPGLTSARHGLAVVAVGQSLYAIGGAAEPNHTASTRTVQILDAAPSVPEPAVSSPAPPAGPRMLISQGRADCTSQANPPVTCVEDITVSSAGSAPLRLTSFGLPPAGVEVGLALTLAGGQAGCTQGMQLPPGKSCLLRVVFDRAASITIHENIPAPDAGRTVQLTAPELSPAPPAPSPSGT